MSEPSRPWRAHQCECWVGFKLFVSQGTQIISQCSGLAIEKLMYTNVYMVVGTTYSLSLSSFSFFLLGKFSLSISLSLICVDLNGNGDCGYGRQPPILITDFVVSFLSCCLFFNSNSLSFSLCYIFFREVSDQ